MREAPNKLVEPYRIIDKTSMLCSDKSHGNNGAFIIKKEGKNFQLMVSDHGGWDHVSVSINFKNTNKHRTPSWKEMCWIKDLFFKESEIVVQYHSNKSDYINLHKYVLHLWRPQNEKIPMPPLVFV